MCGRYVSPEEAAIKRERGSKKRGAHPQSAGAGSNPLGQLGNVAPTHQVPALRRAEGDGDGRRAEGAFLRVRGEREVIEAQRARSALV